MADAGPRAARAVTVGAWRLELTDDGDLAHVLLDGVEVLRGVQFVVRDDAWGTIRGDRDLRIESPGLDDGDGLVAVLRSVHRFPDGVLRASARLAVAPDRIRYEVEATAEGTVVTNRVGFVVLHPLSLAGAEVELRHGEERVSRDRFPADVAPHQPWVGITGLSVAAPGSGRVLSIDLEGDLFETEDQRNWSDASFKTYSRPLALPFPYTLGDGETVRQAVEVSAAPGPASDPVGEVEERRGVLIDRSVVHPRPRLGIQLGPDDLALERPALVEAVRRLGVDHVRVDVVCDGDGVRGAEGLAAVADLPLELAVHLDPAPSTGDDGGLPALARLLSERTGPLRSVLLFDHAAPVTAPDAVSRLRSALGALLDETVVAVGTDDNLAELSRGRPRLAGADEVTFSLNPQVHDSSDRAVIETVEAVPAMIRTASALGAGRAVGIGALTLRPRRSIYRQGVVVDRLGRDSGSIDARQPSDFAAAWLTATLAALVASGVSRVTALELTGPRGVLDADGHLTAAGEVLAAVCSSDGVGIPSVDLSHDIVVLPLSRERANLSRERANEAAHALVADLSGRARRVELDGLTVALTPYQARLVELP
ncbi:hypothetical protein GCM10010988_28350 [Cnuibacter physcomitrellae]|uniref:Uncharacterized protein n=1 Tax=Cnuibacter physcomitrellae TaxID=1619308 RepID=A0A1X9LJL3_9MICO|nr:hypothetical protein [Cnuibacter physcomitrellae]ARJ04111.1 hypothetical protein B5808_01900 [Cnuibacter physcomitrellae]GGI40292.1 hypothetical protein GCM10010988_28350 [Cnuibacter physcomitrellae]